MLLMVLAMIFPVAGILLFFLFPLGEAVPIYLAGTAVSVLCHWAMMRSMKSPVRTGDQAMIGSTGVVVQWNGNSGQVNWKDEIWQAETIDRTSLASGDRVVIERLSELTLSVRPVDPDPL